MSGILLCRRGSVKNPKKTQRTLVPSKPEDEPLCCHMDNDTDPLTMKEFCETNNNSELVKVHTKQITTSNGRIRNKYDFSIHDLSRKPNYITPDMINVLNGNKETYGTLDPTTTHGTTASLDNARKKNGDPGVLNGIERDGRDEMSVSSNASGQSGNPRSLQKKPSFSEQQTCTIKKKPSPSGENTNDYLLEFTRSQDNTNIFKLNPECNEPDEKGDSIMSRLKKRILYCCHRKEGTSTCSKTTFKIEDVHVERRDNIWYVISINKQENKEYVFETKYELQTKINDKDEYKKYTIPDDVNAIKVKFRITNHKNKESNEPNEYKHTIRAIVYLSLEERKKQTGGDYTTVSIHGKTYKIYVKYKGEFYTVKQAEKMLRCKRTL